MGNLKENVLMAFSSILDNKLRYVLTLIGIVLGIGSLVAIVSLGDGVSKNIQDSIVSGGDEKAITLVFTSDDFKMSSKNNPFNEDVKNEIKSIKGVDKLKEDFKANTSFDINGKKTNVPVVYAEDNESLKPNKILKGRNFNENEFNTVKRVCIINEALKKQLFNDSDPIGKTIDVSDNPLMIVGVSKDESMVSFADTGFPSIFVPKGVWSVLYSDVPVGTIKVIISKNHDLDQVSKDITKKLNSDNNLDGKYEVFNMKEVAKSIGKVGSILTGFIASIASISLVVAGIGIMNIMYMAIIERTREIGIRRALGATSKAILFQFLVESLVVCVIGGIIGLIFGMGVALGVGKILSIIPLFSKNIFILGFGIAVLMGIVFGVSPAIKASKLNPIEALSYE